MLVYSVLKINRGVVLSTTKLHITGAFPENCNVVHRILVDYPINETLNKSHIYLGCVHDMEWVRWQVTECRLSGDDTMYDIILRDLANTVAEIIRKSQLIVPVTRHTPKGDRTRRYRLGLFPAFRFGKDIFHQHILGMTPYRWGESLVIKRRNLARVTEKERLYTRIYEDCAMRQSPLFSLDSLTALCQEHEDNLS